MAELPQTPMIQGEKTWLRAIDALNALLDFGFNHLSLERIYLVVRAGNKGAVRSYEKAGMAVEGTLRKSTRYHGELVDDLMMSILRDEWGERG